jgi:hypothetical protein
MKSKLKIKSWIGDYLMVSVLLLLSVLAGCKNSKDRGVLIAKVYDTELYQKDIQFLFKNGPYSFEDSSAIAESYVSNWINNQILVHQGLTQEGLDLTTIEQKVNDFKSDLIIHELENIKIKEQLDTMVSESEMRQYYNKNQADFQLNDYLVKVLYLKIPIDAPDIEDISRSYRLEKETDMEIIEPYAKLYASNFYYDIESWIYFDDLLKEIPLQDINKDRFILKRSKVRFEENGFYYFLNIVDFKLKNTISPFNFEKDNIKARIINLRIKDLRASIKNEIITKAYEQKAVTIY